MIKHQETGAFFYTIKQALKEGAELLDSTLEAQILLSFVLKKDPVYLYTWPEKTLTQEEIKQYFNLLNRRKSGEPVAYITETKEFYGIPLKVKKDVLIPRPETEGLIDIILKEKGFKNVLDLCCGSGAIGLTLKKLKPEWTITLSDISERALKIANENSRDLNIDVKLIQSDLFENIKEVFNIIVSNPPYISKDEYKTLAKDIIKFEPKEALLAQDNGLYFYKKIAHQASQYLKEDGMLIVEIGYKQGETIKNLFEAAGFRKVSIRQDLAGLDRFVIAYKNP